jgi:indole-3-glycerol phosphate synthase
MDGLERLTRNAERLVQEGYYDVHGRVARSPSFLGSLGKSKTAAAVIAEIKFASPTMDRRDLAGTFDVLLDRLVASGPLGLSVLAEPRIFAGNLDYVRRAASKGVPVLMKDIVVDARQVEAAAACGASSVLLIQAIESRGLLRQPIQSFVDLAHDRNLDVVLEVHTLDEWDAAVRTDADVLGLNNRDLATMEVDVETAPRLLMSRAKDRPAIAMSGIDRREQIESMLRAGADAVLIGSAIMANTDPRKKLEEFLHG